jgi:hypothetical protein
MDTNRVGNPSGSQTQLCPTERTAVESAPATTPPVNTETVNSQNTATVAEAAKRQNTEIKSQQKITASILQQTLFDQLSSATAQTTAGPQSTSGREPRVMHVHHKFAGWGGIQVPPPPSKDELLKFMQEKGVPQKTRELFEKTYNQTDPKQQSAFLHRVNYSFLAADPKATIKSTVLQQRIDNYFEASAQTYKLPDGSTVKSRSHFRITDGMSGAAISSDGATSSEVKQHVTKLIQDHNKSVNDPSKQIKLDGEMKEAIRYAAYGRATPEQLQKVTQALIETGELEKTKTRHPGISDSDAVRMLQFDHGVGLDCGGYTQQVFLDTQNKSRSEAGLKPKPGDENMQHLSTNKHFSQVKDLTKAQPADVFVLGKDSDDTGHVVIVRDRHEATAAEQKDWEDPGSFVGSGHKIQVFEVDSSYGAGSSGDLNGGVQRRVWLYNENTKLWATTVVDSSGKLNIQPKPSGEVYAGHPFEGIYRLKE